VVIPYEGANFEEATMNAHIMRDDSKYHTGIITDGMYDGLMHHIKWAEAHSLRPVVLSPLNFIGGEHDDWPGKNQDKTLWQLHQQGAWSEDGWYHLATGISTHVELPGRWTIGGNFLDFGARQSRTPGVCSVT
jgi:hypothetical protein